MGAGGLIKVLWTSLGFFNFDFFGGKKNVEGRNTISNYQKNLLNPTKLASPKKGQKKNWHAENSPIIVPPISRNF